MRNYYSRRIQPWEWWVNTASASTTLTCYGSNTTAGVVSLPVQVAPPPAPLTEVERLLADVEQVCAMGRAA